MPFHCLEHLSWLLIRIMFLLVVRQFILIIIYHMIVYAMKETFKSKIHEYACKCV